MAKRRRKPERPEVTSWVPSAASSDRHKVEAGHVGVIRTEVGLVFYQTYPAGDYYDAGTHFNAFHRGRAYSAYLGEHLGPRSLVLRAKAFAADCARAAKRRD